jgi:hypothetical protein
LLEAVRKKLPGTPFNETTAFAEVILHGVFFMAKFTHPLNNISIASPCSADWNEMYGDDRKRFCGHCKLSVYNLSGLSRYEAEGLIMNAEGRVCVRFYHRADGTVLTKDCPIGWAKLKQCARAAATAVFTLVLALFTGVLFVSLFSKRTETIGELHIPFVTPTPKPIPLMGVVALPPKNANSEQKGDKKPQSPIRRNAI